MRALCFDHFGGPEVLRVQELPDPIPAPGEVLVRTEAVGLNFADVYRRRGTYHLTGPAPYILGYEGAGTVVSTGDPVSRVRVGMRVGFADVPRANASLVAVPEERLIPLPADVTTEVAAAVLLQGLTAQYLVRDSHLLQEGESVLIHAAAGGVGSLLVQLAVHRGARVLGLTSTEEKAARVRQLGAESTSLYSEGWVERARAFGDGGVDVVYDAVGSTLLQSLEAAKLRGHVVFYGMSGGEPPLVAPRLLMDTGRTLTGGDLWNVLVSREERLARAAELFGWLRSGALHVEISGRFPFARGEEAHRYLESRTSTGKVLLIP